MPSRTSYFYAAIAALIIALPAQSKTMEGCLDSSEQGFLLTAQKQTVELNGDVDFKPHVGHRVSVSGDQQGGFFLVRSIDHVDDECAADEDHVEALPPPDDDRGRKPGLSADQQSNKQTDLDITARIRRAVVNDDALSIAAHNVKIITKDGQVTLRGRLRSAEEKSAVVAKAEAVAGAGNVTDRTTIKPEKPNKS